MCMLFYFVPSKGSYKGRYKNLIDPATSQCVTSIVSHTTKNVWHITIFSIVNVKQTINNITKTVDLATDVVEIHFVQTKRGGNFNKTSTHVTLI